MYSDLSTSCFNVAIAIARQHEQANLISTLQQGKIAATMPDNEDVEIF